MKWLKKSIGSCPHGTDRMLIGEAIFVALVEIVILILFWVALKNN